MTSILQGLVDGEAFVLTIIILFLIGYFFYKEWPEFKKRISKSSVDEREDQYNDQKLSEDIQNIKQDISDLKKDVVIVKERQSRDYNRMNDIEKENLRQKKAISDSLSERKLLMRGIMACLDGLEQQGCNHIVPSTKQDISNYLNDVAHAEEVE